MGAVGAPAPKINDITNYNMAAVLRPGPLLYLINKPAVHSYYLIIIQA